MSGTIMKDLKLTKVVDGYTVKVEINGKQESLRLCCLDTEESLAGRGRGYVYVSGKASLYPQNDNGKPQIVLNDVKQLSGLPPGSYKSV